MVLNNYGTKIIKMLRTTIIFLRKSCSDTTFLFHLICLGRCGKHLKDTHIMTKETLDAKMAKKG